MFIILVARLQFLENLKVPAAIGWAIVALTLLVRAVVIPLYRRQLVSKRRTSSSSRSSARSRSATRATR